MSDSPTSFSTSGDPAPRADAGADPLAGDWSQGLPGPIRVLGVPTPRRLALEGVTAPPPPALRTQPAAVNAPGGWEEEAGGDPLQSLPPQDGSIGEAPPSVIVAMDASLPAPTSQAAREPSAPVEPGAAQEPPGGEDALPPADAPTPWSEAVAQPAAAADALWPTPAPHDVTETWTVPPAAPASAQPADASGAAAQGSWVAAAPSESAEVKTEEAWPAPASAEPADEEVDVVWSAPPAATPAEEKVDETWSMPPAEPVQEWQPAAPAADFAPVAQPEAPPVAPAWSPVEGGPDWSAPPQAGPAAEEDWGSAPPAPGGTASSSDAVAPDWSAGGAGTGAQEDWTAPAPAPASGPAWNAPAAGASALEQLESDPPDPEPGAAQELFGTVPMGASLSGEDDDQLGPPVELGAPEDVLRPVQAPSDLLTPIDAAAETPAQAPEDFLMPVDPDDDPDLPVAMADAPRAKTLAVMRPANAGALEVFGEHRVAVHTRGGRTLRGTVRDIDLSKAQFPLQPQGGGEPETIYHSDVKVIFFMLPPGEKAKPAEGGKVRVKLSDGRVIEGGRDGADARHGFFLVPGDAARTNTRRIYVAREAAEEIEG